MPSSARGRMTFCSRLTIGTPERVPFLHSQQLLLYTILQP